MPTLRTLVESAEEKGLRLFLEEGKVMVQAPQSLDRDAEALLEKLRGHREEIKALLSQSAPPLLELRSTDE